MVAMSLLVILSGALYGTYFALMRGRDTAVTKMEERREISTTLDQLRRELSATFYNKENKRLRFVVEDRDYFGKPASTLDFTAIAPPSEGLPVSDQMQIAYVPVEKDGKITLARQAKDLYANIEPLRVAQMEELDGFLVECSGDGVKWVRSWNTAPNFNFGLPKAVRVTLRIREGEKTMEFSTVALLRVGS
jgi:general secretion pathway protein J